MKNTPDIYRFFSKKKVSSVRLMLYVCMGLFISNKYQFFLFAMDLLLVFSGILFASLLNDYFDYIKLGENNAIASLLESGKYSRKIFIVLLIAPGVIPVVLFFILYQLHISEISLTMLCISFIMSIVYCMPPFRYKEKLLIGLILPPIGIYLLFLQGVFISGTPDLPSISIAVNIFLYAWYLEFLHLADDAISKNEYVKIKFKTAILLSKAICAMGIVLSIFEFVLTPLSLVFCVYWYLRLITLNDIHTSNLKFYRHDIFSEIYRIEEFGVIACSLILRIIYT